jgi:hypothetical protein
MTTTTMAALDAIETQLAVMRQLTSLETLLLANVPVQPLGQFILR